jgi:2,3-dihydroxybiphenyl 1,2-dioxygenase
MTNDLEIAYLGLEVPEPITLTPFFGDVIGLMPGEPGPAEADLLTWRNDAKAHRLIVQPGPADDAVFVGLEAADAAAFDRTVQRLRDLDYEITEGSEGDASERRVTRLAHTTAPWGIRLELVLGLADATASFASPLVSGGFLTDGVGFGHAVFATTAFDESHRFLTEGLGFTQSDWIEMQIAEGIELEVRFYHCNSRHHTIALAHAPFDLPQRLHHIMVETIERDDVGAAFDRAWESGLDIPMGLGLHDNDRMFSFYVKSPAGFLVEVGNGARTITEPWTDNRRYDSTSVWGHKPLRVA